MVISKVYHGGNLLGEAEICPTNPSFAAWNRDIRISHFSPQSERCPPLAVLHTIAVGGSCFKVESELPGPPEESLIFLMHTACFKEKKTAVMSLGETEIHLVALACRNSFRNVACFWGFSISTGLYNSCLVLMNIRCLGIVFDLDETLIVANTSRSFEDKLDALQRKINSETDPQRASVMLAEVKRYQDDRSILKQYTESDQVLDNGMVFKTQAEVVPPVCDGQQPIIRPIIRLYERNIILTRINPLNRDTSVLVRLRPGWDDFRSYLTARGRKRFEVYVCTMAERDYALEMWRLLDPESNLINGKQLLDRIVCVKSGLRKSLLNVFHDGVCHPKLALVVDDRLKVWDDVDQPRVHVVPAYAPYYAPEAETNSSVPVLCVARNVACNVRACFFREFDDSLLPYISAVRFEDDILGYSPTPDVGNHLISEDDASNGNKDPLSLDGLADVDGDRRLKEPNPPMSNSINSRLIPCIPNAVVTSSTVFPPPAPLNVVSLHGNQVSQIIPSINPPGHSTLLEPSVQGSPAREEGEVPESELDPDTRRRLLILQHGQDTRDQTTNETLLPGGPLQAPLPPVPSRGNWFPVDGEISPRQLDRASKENLFDSNAPRFEKKRHNNPSFFRDMENRSRSNKSYHENNRFSRKMYRGEDHGKENYSSANFDFFPGEDIPSSRLSSSNKNTHYDSEQGTRQYSGNFVEVLRNIAAKCGTKVEFRTDLVDSIELQFCVEVWFAGEKNGEGVGRTRKDAQLRASENSLKNLASRYISNPTFGHLSLREDSDKPCHLKQNGVVSNSNSPGDIAIRDDPLQQSQFVDRRLDGYTAASPISALKELCTLQGFRFTFQTHPSVPIDSINDGEVYAQVEVCGEVLGKGVGGTWEEAKMQAAEEALGNWNSSMEQFVFKRSSSPRSLQTSPNKRLKTDLPRSFQRIPSSRYSKNGMPVP